MNEPVLNEAIELHDSTLEKIELEGLEVKLHFTPAYIHKSAGEPGVAPGTEWIQNVVILIRSGALEGETHEMPCELTDGILIVGTNLWRNVIPLPLECDGDIKLKLEIMWGGQFAITGKGISAVLIGKPEYIQEFDGIQS